uniref:Uncharacterized protein n=1 Tax=Opuntia streptacantha TaxID=393608 RepID=A0A7C8ZCI4_OPUST
MRYQEFIRFPLFHCLIPMVLLIQKSLVMITTTVQVPVQDHQSDKLKKYADTYKEGKDYSEADNILGKMTKVKRTRSFCMNINQQLFSFIFSFFMKAKLLVRH